MRTQYTVFDEPFHVWAPNDVRRIRLALNKSTAEFADMFAVGEDLVKAWESPETAKRHRDCSGPAARLMLIAAQIAAGKRANLIRCAASGEL